MLHLEQQRALTYHRATLSEDLIAAARRIPPLWDLENYVAVNPFLGFSAQPIAEATAQMADQLGVRPLPPLAFYQQQWRAGRFGRVELARAAERADQDFAALEAILQGQAPPPLRAMARVFTLAERYDWQHTSQWESEMARQVANWCAVQFAGDAAAWGTPASAPSLFAAWREFAMYDRAYEIRGLAGWRAWVKALPTDPMIAIEQQVLHLEIAPEARRDYFTRLLSGVFGWAAYLRRQTWGSEAEDWRALSDLIAIRLCCDAAVLALAPHGRQALLANPTAPIAEDESLRLICQAALEERYLATLAERLLPPPTEPMARPAVQAIFCIDVRSEVLRRHLEACSPAIETRGFAGFFGVALEWQTDGGSSARCPVLLAPSVAVQANGQAPRAAASALKRLLAAPAAYTAVETLGLGFALQLLGDSLGWRSSPQVDEGAAAVDLSGLALATRVELAASILKNTGLSGAAFARLVLLAGHEGRSENNAHKAGLDCGACGGHGGAPNARVAAALLNDAAVRAVLAEQGYAIPQDCYFVAGLHHTSDDRVQLLDRQQVPASHRADLAQFEQWLSAAGEHTRAERAERLAINAAAPDTLARRFAERARDWSQPRPEWALARNAAFIAARRTRTRAVNLEGRSFLHDYDWTSDPDNSVLTLILTAPLVVASWINLQYFASTVDNERLGSGSKALHNRIGTIGVVAGNGGDLRTGLSLQSVQAPDGQWYHEPLRLQAIIEAPCERIEAVLAAHNHVRDLVVNGWISLYSLDGQSNQLRQRHADGTWQLV